MSKASDILNNISETTNSFLQFKTIIAGMAAKNLESRRTAISKAIAFSNSLKSKADRVKINNEINALLATYRLQNLFDDQKEIK